MTSAPEADGPKLDDIAALRTHLAGGGRAAWRDLDALTETPGFRDFLRTEFPGAARLRAGPDRRHFFRLMAASFALAGLAGCGDTGGREQEVPYVRQPERITPSAKLDYASTTVLDGFANGVLVTTRNGRPIKVEGNERHPWSGGGTDIFGQASILTFYDPDRSQSVRFLNQISDWSSFRGAMTGQIAALRALGGRGLALLTGPVTSPSLIAQIEAMRKSLPAMRWHSHAPSERASLYEGTRRAFGQPLETRWRFDKARVIVALDGDFLDVGPQQVGLSRNWVEARQASAKSGHLLELHTASATPNLTSAKSDYHVPASPDTIALLAESLLAAAAGHAFLPGNDPVSRWRDRAWAALAGAQGAGIVMAGACAPASVQETVHRLNGALGNLGKTVFYTRPVVAQTEDLASLAQAIDRNEVKTLLILDANPAYTAPADLGFTALLNRVNTVVHAGLFDDETAANATWHLPLAHPLEAWGDARSLDGTVSLIQPTIAPLWNGRSLAEIVSLFGDSAPRSGFDLLYSHWLGDESTDTFNPRWRQALLDGFLPKTALPEEPPQFQPAKSQPVQKPVAPPAAPPGQGDAFTVDVVFRPDSTVWDGSYANNGWLQELPKALTKMTWSNAVLVSPAFARRANLSEGDMVSLEVAAPTHGKPNTLRTEGPVWVLPGQPDDVATVTLGYGRNSLPYMLFTGHGYDAYALRASASPWHLPGVTLRKTGGAYAFALTQVENTMEGHDLVRVQHMGTKPVGDDKAFTQPTIYEGVPTHEDGRAWAMVIDLDACIGCNACVVACQAENNVPVVGENQVRAGRAMHWLRVDRYYGNGPSPEEGDNPDTHFQPVPCMMCQQAPCELGCPVEATLHDSEGLNLMVYNRCIGTRTCSSYCPYKVRRFNYYDYANDSTPASVKAQRNPEVSVRARGVMEKCTYCVQRIVEARIESDKSNQPIPDGAVKTACQGACPTNAITFGDLNTHGSAVAAARKDSRNYALLGELNTRPRTTYLAEFAPPTEAKA